MITEKKRWYYTDALAAAWMAKHFEMRFVYNNGLEVGAYSIYSFIGIPLADYEPPYYIHPDSLHLLEPKVGDVAFNIEYKFYEVIAQVLTMNQYWLGKFGNSYDSEQDEGHVLTGDKDLAIIFAGKEFSECTGWDDTIKIIQRNGMSFHWPSEASDA